MTASTEDLIERLEAEARSWESTRAEDFTPLPFEPLLTEAAQALRSLQAEASDLRLALRDARNELSEASCWTATKDWTADDFRQHVRAANLHQCRLSNARARSALNTGSGEG